MKTKWGPIGKEVFDRTYSRIKPNGKNESWDNTVYRVVDGNCDLINNVPETERLSLFDNIKRMKIMPAGRHLWSSGVGGRQFLFNCHRAGFSQSLSDHCCFLFDVLMQGGGVGSNYSSDYTSKISKVHYPEHIIFRCDSSHKNHAEIVNIVRQKDLIYDDFTVSFDFDLVDYPDIEYVIVDDSREGWVHSLYLLMNQNLHKKICFDLSEVRATGELIKTFGGTSSGPAPLANLLCEILGILFRSKGVVSPIDVMEIDHAIASCVIAGNVRRSARMSIMHWRDPYIDKFMKLKKEDGEHWSTNISVEIDDQFFDSLYNVQSKYNLKAKSVLNDIAIGMAKNGEPGIYNSSNASKGEYSDVRSTNPCGEIALEEWENCNLGHINLALLDDDDDFEDLAILMTKFLIRASFGDISSKKQQAVNNMNRRIGVGVYGFQEWLYNRFEFSYSDLMDTDKYEEVGSVLQDIYKVIDSTAESYAEELGINKPIKLTTVAPTGTISLLSGHTSGIHPIYAKFFIRRVRYSVSDPHLQYIPSDQKEIDSNNPNTVVVSYPCIDPALDYISGDLVESVDELSINEQLRVQELFQEFWADNAVSFTVNIGEDPDVDNIEDMIMEFGQVLKGMTMFPEFSRSQAPIERITDIDNYSDLLK